MKTWLLEGHDAPPGDDSLVRELNALPRDSGAGEELLIGFLDPGGALFRIVVAEGLAEFMTLAAILQELGHRLERPDAHGLQEVAFLVHAV
jgi:hypothetical protein